ncbi:flagellar biosynthesis protein FlgA [Cryptosporangium sp. NPDC051539]|uniref:flagellar biosynthesis protein FlgA n=1 Tax=Cryptosporangium sp. NPDC051539 TaxID=3363962 RepID=UPI00379E1A69
MSAPVSPQAARRRVPSWLDLRFLLGVLLVVVSVVGGARLFAAADDTVRVWAVGSDLAAGTILRADDLVRVRVRLPESSGRYLAASGAGPVGRPLSRDVGAGELLPRAAVAGRVCGSEVSVPVNAQHAPATLRRGVRVDVFATPRGGATVRVLAAATVQGMDRGSGLGGGWALVVRVPDTVAPVVVRAVRTADLDVVTVTGRPPDPPCGEPSPSEPSPSGPLPSGLPSSGPPLSGPSPSAAGTPSAGGPPFPSASGGPVPGETGVAGPPGSSLPRSGLPRSGTPGSGTAEGGAPDEAASGAGG